TSSPLTADRQSALMQAVVVWIGASTEPTPTSSNAMRIRRIVDRRFTKQLEEVLRRGVRVTIDLTDGPRPDQSAIELERMRSSYPGLAVRSGSEAQFYHLICDDAFALVSNRPFLSITGKVRSFHHVVGYLMQRND